MPVLSVDIPRTSKERRFCTTPSRLWLTKMIVREHREIEDTAMSFPKRSEGLAAPILHLLKGHLLAPLSPLRVFINHIPHVPLPQCKCRGVHKQVGIIPSMCPAVDPARLRPCLPIPKKTQRRTKSRRISSLSPTHALRMQDVSTLKVKNRISRDYSVGKGFRCPVPGLAFPQCFTWLLS